MVMTSPSASPTSILDPTDLDSVVNAHAQARATYDDLEKWWNGDQRVILTDRLKQWLTSLAPKDVHFSDNLLEVVVAATANRMHVSGFTVPGERVIRGANPGEQTLGPLAQHAADVWAVNRADALQLQVHETALALGDAYVIAEWDPDRGVPRFFYNDPRLVRMHYDPKDTTRQWFASKVWTIPMQRGEAVRLNLYFPDHIQRWIRNGNIAGGMWRAYTDDEGPAVIDWTDGAGEPLGIAVIHFANNPRGLSRYGRSELLNAIPLQRALNKTLHDLLRVSDAQGWPQRYASGVQTSTTDLNAEPGALWQVEDKDAKFGQLDPADPKGIIEILTKFEHDVAVVSQTPEHLFNPAGALPSGESLKTAEAPLVKKVENRQIRIGNAWEDLQWLAARLAQANNALQAELPPTGFACAWDDAESRPAELDHILAINAKQGLSTKQRLREYGYTDEEIDRITEEADADATKMAETLAAGLADTPGGSAGGRFGQP